MIGGRAVCESYYAIDVRDLYRGGRSAAGGWFAARWTRNGEPLRQVAVRIEIDSVALVFSKRAGQRVSITWTSCHYGGRRPWFMCPVSDCGRRVAKLYGGERFACRHCYGLAYASQREGPGDRSRRRAQDIRQRLGGSANLLEPFPVKPRGMHWATYNRLRARAAAAERRSFDMLVKAAGRLFPLGRHAVTR